ncbi:CAT RNA binding domain-containing protein [Vagococcus jeotgali]|nr:CAT RNA binding domain-containing protein [Vagococcus sp. B2T-5]
MVIEKIINNNVVFSKDKSGKEIVVAGKGIAFQKKSVWK